MSMSPRLTGLSPPVTRATRKIPADKNPFDETKHIFKEYAVKNGKLYKRHSRLGVSKDARLQICRLYHDDVGHLSVEKTLKRITRNYRFVSKYVKPV